MYEKAEGGKD